MKTIPTWMNITIMVVGLALLSACRQATTPEVEPTASDTPTVAATETAEPTSEPVITVYPGPGRSKPQAPETQVGAYPGGGAPTLVPTIGAYPGAPTRVPTISSYPEPGESSTFTPTPVGSYPGPSQPTLPPTEGSEPTAYPGPDQRFPTPTSPYPGPESSPGAPTPTSSTGSSAPTATSAPYPAPGATATAGGPSGTPAATPSPTVPGQPTLTPTITLTPTLVRIGQQVTTPADFDLISGQVQLIEFFADWAPLSNSMAPILNGLDAQYGDRINFVYLDIEDPANGVYKALLLEGQLPPLFFLVDGNGVVIDSWSGYVSQAVLEFALQNAVP